MKVLQINNVPYGSTGKIMMDIDYGLRKNGYESVVCFGRAIGTYQGLRICGELYSRIGHAVSRITGNRYGGYALSTKKVIGVIRKERPSVVHIQCINGYFVNLYRLLRFLAKEKIATVITLHAEFMYTGNCSHAEACEKWIVGCGKCPRLWDATESYFFDRTAQSWGNFYNVYHLFRKDKLCFAAVSDWVKSRALQSPLINEYEIKTIQNGINIDIFKPRYDSNVLLKYGVDKKYILFVTALFDLQENSLKGGQYIIDIADKVRTLGYNIVIVAMFGENNESLPSNVNYLGRVESQDELAVLYTGAASTLILSRRETFCMPVAESLACGTPVVGFEACGPESIALHDYSRFVEYGDTDKLVQAIEEMAQKKENARQIAEEANKAYSRERMYNDYIKLYDKLVDGREHM